jgi:hypothetical protein
MTAAEINKILRRRTIVNVRVRRFNARINKKGVVWATDPIIELDDGTTVSFLTQETETGEYGIELCINNQPPNAGEKR